MSDISPRLAAIVASERFVLRDGERPFDLAFAVRVGALDGRHGDRLHSSASSPRRPGSNASATGWSTTDGAGHRPTKRSGRPAEVVRDDDVVSTISPRLAAVVDSLPLRPGMRVLEIGCGPGAAYILLVERDSHFRRGCSVHGDKSLTTTFWSALEVAMDAQFVHVVLRLVHVIAGVIWVGAAFVLAAYVIPSVRAAGHRRHGARYRG